MRNSVKFGVMLEGFFLEEWQVECLESLKNLEGVSLDLVIINANPQNKNGTWRRRIRYDRILFQIFRVYLKFNSPLRKNDYSHVLNKICKIHCKTKFKGKYSEYFYDSDIDFIKSRNLDFILRFGFGIVRGEILQAAKHGIWSFHHDDEQKYRGGPPCFWEIYYSDFVTGAILQRLTDKLDSGYIIYKGFFKTIKHSYRKNLGNVYSATAEWPAFVASQIQEGLIDDNSWTKSDSNAKIFYYPTNWETFRFLIKLILNSLKKIYSATFRHESWSIGIIDEPIQKFMTDKFPNNIQWIKSPTRKRFFADPFGVIIDDHLEIMFEDYDYSSKRGVIASIQRDSMAILSEPKIQISENYHLSYPYIIDTNEGKFCIPESHQSKKISYYQFHESQKCWKYGGDLIKGTTFVDPTIFHWDKKWWLFCTEFKNGSNERLMIYYSLTVQGPWNAHKKNPVKVDIRSSQSAGTPFIFDGCLYRPAQDCSESYGSSISINKILKLTDIEFEEKFEKSIIPFWNDNSSKGIHTISSCGNFTLIDSKQEKFIFSALINKLIKKM